ncbi:hypothetical protein [Kribbella sp. CA-294648]|uniref:hypothetical protein n=1 Tax=Kribbella sp. CA-294648 TaxID=3239948 RepID=UPI003D8C2603
MKLTDLREELAARANSTDDTADLLPGVRDKIARTKRRRTATAGGAVGCLAIIAAVASGIIPTTKPQPADDVPRDHQKGDIILPAFEGADRLEKGWIGDLGHNTLNFNWVPEGSDTRFATVCAASMSSGHFLTVKVNGYVVGTAPCFSDPADDQPTPGIGVRANSVLWLAAPAGKPARVSVQLTDEQGQAVTRADAQIALGIYRTAAAPPEGPPVQAPPTSPADYVKDGIRYRARVGGDTLLGAKIADRGTSSLEFDFTATDRPVTLHDFCTATSPGTDPEYQLSVKFNGVQVGKTSCAADSTDAGAGSDWAPVTQPKDGQRVRVSVQLEDKNGRPVSRPIDWVGLGIYAKGEQRTIDDTTLDVVREYGGRNYRLAEVKQADVKTTKDLELATPADKPFLVAYGTAGLTGDQPRVETSGLTHGTPSVGGGIGLVGEAARPAGKAKIQLSTGKYTSGHLVIALYLPAD